MKKRKTEYERIREELSKVRHDLSYFTEDFYKIFMQAKARREECIRTGTDDSYYRDGILLFHSYDPIYESEIYKKNSCTYCEFLSFV